jgi:DNA-binding NarL/FixJ family response regulator
MYRPKVIIADDHTVLHGAFLKLLEQECDVLGCVRDGRALITAAPKLKPDVILLDIAMPLLNGLDAGSQLKRMMPTVKLLFLTANEDPDLMREAFKIGASGYLLKHCAASELLLAIREVLSGRSYITPLLTQTVESVASLKQQRMKPAETLTSRQREILQLLGEGHSMKEAAGYLGITPRTVAFHKYRLMQEFRLKNNADVIHFAMRHRLISPSSRGI